MSLIPILFQPSRLFDQHFGLAYDVEDLMNSIMAAPSVSSHCTRPWRCMRSGVQRQDSGSQIILNKDKYQVCLDVQQFAPNEITVKTVDREIVIEGKHEEKEDEHGYISRHFIRKYTLPENCKPEDVVSTLSSDGILSISAPKNKPALEGNERIVNIVQTGPAHKTIQKQNVE